jgi:hypothetical protein
MADRGFPTSSQIPYRVSACADPNFDALRSGFYLRLPLFWPWGRCARQCILGFIQEIESILQQSSQFLVLFPQLVQFAHCLIPLIADEKITAVDCPYSRAGYSR